LYAEVFLALHNKMRTEPKSFIPELEELVAEYDGKLIRTVKIGNRDVEVTSNEGDAAVKDLIQFLKE